MKRARQRRFFIYSTPRSGSAWLSNFLTTNHSFCQHEPLARNRIARNLTWTDHRVTGAIDTLATTIDYTPPEGTHIYHLWRDPAEVNESLERLGLKPYDLSAYRSDGFHHKHLFDLGYLEEVWREVTRLPFDLNRAQALVNLNVQRDLTTLFT